MNPNYPPTPQQQDSQFMAEAAQAAARINAEASGGTMYGAPRSVQEVNELPPLTAQQNEISANLGRVSGAAMLDRDNYVDAASQRGVLYAKYANHDYVARQDQQHMDELLRSQKKEDDDRELVDA